MLKTMMQVQHTMGQLSESVESFKAVQSLQGERLQSLEEKLESLDERWQSHNQVQNEKMHNFDIRFNRIESRLDSHGEKLNSHSEKLNSLEVRLNTVAEKLNNLDKKIYAAIVLLTVFGGILTYFSKSINDTLVNRLASPASQQSVLPPQQAQPAVPNQR